MKTRNKRRLLAVVAAAFSTVGSTTIASAQVIPTTGGAQGPFGWTYPQGFDTLSTPQTQTPGLNRNAVPSVESQNAIAVPPFHVLSEVSTPNGRVFSEVVPANGTQDYQCRATGTGFAWAFSGPRANLFNIDGEQAGTHFNLQGTSLAGTASDGPRWRWNDGTMIRGRVVTSARGRTASDIPVLLLRAEYESRAIPGAEVTGPQNAAFIQRTNTVGGVAPAASLCNASSVGSFANVPYQATYLFWGASQAFPTTGGAQGPYGWTYPVEFDHDFSPNPRTPGVNRNAVPSAVSQAAIAVPPGLVSQAFPANGTQDYQCRANATGFAWVFSGPRANLFNTSPSLDGTHFNLQGTPLAGTPIDGPRWRWNDGTLIRGRVVTSAPGRTPADIPVLLLRTQYESRRPFGSSYFAPFGNGPLNAAFIQRTNTVGGVAPASSLCNASSVGSYANVPYQATYLFWSPPVVPIPIVGEPFDGGPA